MARRYPYVDPESYRFARRGSRMNAAIGGEERTVLKDENDCRDLLLPAGAWIEVGYGVDRDRLRAAGRAQRPPVFTLRLRPGGATKAVKDVLLLRDTVGLDGEAWRERKLSLDRYGLQQVELCVEIDAGAPSLSRPRDRFAYWEQPDILTARDRARAAEGDGDDAAAKIPGGLTPEELEVQRQHLKALGYIH